MMVTPDVRHKHLVVRAEVANPPKGGDTQKMETWLQSLIDRIEMKTMYGPKAMYCEVAGNRGMTAFAIIETSHLAFHSWDECDPAIIQLDVYTCSDLLIDDVIDAMSWFEPTKIEYKFLDREHGLTLIEER